MAVDGIKPETVEEVMRTEIESMQARHHEGKKVLETIGRCGPAFGLVATLLGLILMLGNLSNAEAIGPSMAMALIGTLYGVATANFFAIPMAEKLGCLSHEESLLKEIVVRGVLSIQSGDSPRIVQQKLNTFLPPKLRPGARRGGRVIPWPPRQASFEGGAPEYMVSYADMLTIMLAFFIVLYASAGTTSSGISKGEKTGQVDKSREAVGPDKGYGPKEGGGGHEAVGGEQEEGFPGTDDPLEPGTQIRDERLDKVFQSLRYRFGPDWTISNCWTGGPPQLRNLRPEKLDRGPGPKSNIRPSWPKPGNDNARARSPRPGDDLLVGGRIYFDEFSADLTDPQVAKLRKAADDLAGKPQRIEIRGHSSRRPLPKDSAYRDPWDVAYDRCRKVRDFLVAQGIDPRRIRLSVAGDNEPLDDGGEPLPTQPNSRVEVRILNEFVQSPTGPRESRPAAPPSEPAKAAPAQSPPATSSSGEAKK